MAAAWLNQLGPKDVKAYSAGLTPGTLNPLVVKAMQESGIDISHHIPQSVDTAIATGIRYDYIITVCDAASAQCCPLVPGAAVRLH